MKSIVIDFYMIETGQVAPVGNNRTSVHVIVDVKMHFTRKNIWVLDRHRSQLTEVSTYAVVVSHKIDWICFTYSALKDSNMWACIIKNAFLQAPTTEKYFIICGQEFS